MPILFNLNAAFTEKYRHILSALHFHQHNEEIDGYKHKSFYNNFARLRNILYNNITAE
jgi:hypothetical protein